jgi:hypothetical protein
MILIHFLAKTFKHFGDMTSAYKIDKYDKRFIEWIVKNQFKKVIVEDKMFFNMVMEW